METAIVSGTLAPLVRALCDTAGPCSAERHALFSLATEGWRVLLVWSLLLGPAMTCSCYEPTYVAIDQWFGERQGRALGVLTFAAGLSTSIFIPLTQWLVESASWRDATLAPAAVQLTVVGALALLFVRDRPRWEARPRSLKPGRHALSQKQLEYTFRLTAMERYKDFDVTTPRLVLPEDLDQGRESGIMTPAPNGKGEP